IRLRNTTVPNVVAAYATFAVDLNLMVSQFNLISPAPPLSLNSNLIRAARLHSGDMFTNQFQGHIGSNGSSLPQRATNSGYLNWSTVGENVFSYSRDVFYGHAGFDVDWGGDPSTGGMQNPPDHRNNIHSANFREIGIGVVDGVNGPVGPQLVTQDFGSRFGLTPFVTGVVYFDLNTNGFYDLGEGVGGVGVEVTGSSFYAITANSGGYSVPVPGIGNDTVTFSTRNLSDFQTTALIVSNNNFKVDFRPLYSPPIISGPDPAFNNRTNIYTFNAVGAATSYRWQQTRRIPFTAVEGAENGSSNITAVISPGYPLIVSDTKASGASSFHLAQPVGAMQSLTLNASLLPAANSSLIFASRLGFATTNQMARAQISSDSGLTWQNIWSQAGTGGSGESVFSRKTNSLAAFAGQPIRVRFIYEFNGGMFFNQTSLGVGFYLDDISVSNAEQLIEPIVTEIPGTTFNFIPMTNGNYVLQAGAKILNRFLPYGPATFVSVITPPATVRVTQIQILAGNQVQIDFQILSGLAANFQLQSTTNLSVPFMSVAASLQTIVPGSQYRFTATAGGAQSFYRVQSLP
ncbi:MAG: CAP domain-containing protein, partial [Limisphaerales bacterium]